ncbi:MAG TPA: hypothetical protein VJZ77_13780 [Blastocatellia bacterium]|nr:hypothetical protein [Blastocatellia bacterium]
MTLIGVISADTKMHYAVEKLQRRLTDAADPDRAPLGHARLSALEVGERLYLDFCGSPFDEPYHELCQTLILPDVAFRLGSLSLRAPADEASNGTRNWNLTPLVEAQVLFPNLRSFSVEQNSPGDHNRIIVAADYDEDGVIGRLLCKAPSLEALTVPTAPDRTFFALERRLLRFLNVDAGYDAQGFIRNIADSSCFPRLETLEFGEFNETYLDDFPSGCTPFDDYRRLFKSKAFSTVRLFVWRNPVCSEAEIEELRSLRPKSDLQIQIVQFSSRYV